ncbi:MAG: sulfate transporter [Alcaligenaceae bacterium]|nr:sulfate transporter [Alcaligenaceae bacterium]
MTATTNTPDGYKRDGQGRLIPIETIKAIDLARDELVQQLVTDARATSEALGQFKAKAFEDIQAFVELSAEHYGARIGGQKGNVTLMSFDGRYKVLRACQDNITFDERLQAAKALIDECLRDWTKDTGPEVRALIDRAFEVNKEGNLNEGRILALRRVEIKDDRWKRAMEAIGESVQVVGSKNYIRVYERVGTSDRYEPIPLDVAGA